MSTDATQIMQQPTGATPPSDVPAPTTPVDPLHQAVSAILTPLAGPLIADLAADIKTDVTSVRADVTQTQGAIQGLQAAADAHGGLIGVLQAQAAKHEAQLAAMADQVSTALVGQVETSANTRHWLVVMLVGACLIGALGLFGFYLAGSTRAADTIAGAPALALAALGIVVAHAKGLIPTGSATTTTVGA